MELNRLLTEEESWNIKLSSLQRVADYFKAAHGEMTKERDEALNECAIAKAEVICYEEYNNSTCCEVNVCMLSNAELSPKIG